MALTALAFLAVYAFMLMRAFTVHPKWGLFTYIAVFYLHPPMRWWGASLPSAIRWSLLAALVTLIAASGSKFRSHATPWSSLTVTKCAIALVTWMWIQLAWANPMHFEDLILFSKYLLLFYLIYHIMADKQGLVDFSIVHVLGCFYFGMLALDAGGAGRLEYIGGPGTNDSNTLGMHVSTSLFFAGAIILSQPGWRRWLMFITVPVITNCVVQTESRGAFLGAACGSLAFYYYAPKEHRKIIMSLGTIAVFVLLAYAPAAYWERIASIGAVTNEEVEVDHSAESRIVIMKAQWEMFKDYPMGLGARTTAYLSRGYLATEWLTARPGQDRETQGARASHNTLMAVVTDYGLPGIIITVVAGFAVLGMLRRLKVVSRTCRDKTLVLCGAAAAAALTTVLIAGLFTNYVRAEIQLWSIALIAAILQIAARMEAQEQTAPGDAGHRRPDAAGPLPAVPAQAGRAQATQTP